MPLEHLTQSALPLDAHSAQSQPELVDDFDASPEVRSDVQSGAIIVLDHSHALVEPAGTDVIQGLSQTPKQLSAQYFYDDRGSELFEQICQLPEYYPTRTEAWILREYADEIAELTDSHELIELGSGSSTKTRLLLDAYRSRFEHRPETCHYLPVDISGGILHSSVLQLQAAYPDFWVQGLLGTYDQSLDYLAHQNERSRLLFFLGSSIGNFPPADFDAFVDRVAQSLKPGDFFLLGVDLAKEIDILEAAYNDRQGVTAAFNLNMLAHLNWRFAGNFNLDWFEHQAIYNTAESQIEMYLHCRQDCVVSLDRLNFRTSFQAGESILTEISRKFRLDRLQTQLSDRGLNTVKTWSDPHQWFGLVLCQAA